MFGGWKRRWRISSHVAGGPIYEEEEGYVALQIGFWRRLDRNLDRLPLSGADRSRIVASLEAAVPRPDEVAPAKAGPAKDEVAALSKGEAPVAKLGLIRDE